MVLEEPTLLSPWERDRIRQSFDVWLARRARRFHCEAAQIVAVIESRAKPVVEAVAGSAMSEGAAVAASPETAETGSRLDGGRTLSATSEPMDVTAGETAPLSPSRASDVAAGRARKPSPERSDAEPVRQAGGDTSIPPATVAQTVPAERPSPIVAAGGDAVEPPAPPSRKPDVTGTEKNHGRRAGMQDKVRDAHDAHPDWPASRIASELDCSTEYVRATASRLQLTLPFEGGQRTEPLIGTLKDRILTVRREHPDWTAAMAAKHLDAKLSSVSAYASLLGFKWPTTAEYERGRSTEQPFIGEVALRQHYAEGRKRLGAPS